MVKCLKICICVLVYVTALNVTSHLAVAGTLGAATIEKDFGCGLSVTNTTGNCSWGETNPKNISIVSNDANGNTVLKCYSWNSTTNCVDKGVAILRNFECSTFAGNTFESFAFVTRQGYFQLTCIINPGSTAFDNPND